MTRQDRIIQQLQDAFSPSFLAVHDNSESHRGHGGWRIGGETHFKIEITSTAFTGKNRIDTHRMINAALADEFNSGLHALEITALHAEA